MPLSRRPHQPDEAGSGARQFLYLNSSLTKELLAGVDQGLFGVQQVTTDETSERKIGANVGGGIAGVGLGVSGGKTTSLARRAQTDLEQTSESQFARLVTGLHERGALTNVGKAQTERLKALGPGDVVEIPASITMSDGLKLGTAVASLRFESRRQPEDGAQERARHQMFGKLSGATIGLYNFLRAVPGLHVDPELVATTAGADGVAFTGKLDARELRMKLEDGELHGTVLAKLERPFADGDRRITVIGIYR